MIIPNFPQPSWPFFARDRLQEQHETFDRLRCKYSPPGPHRPLADNVSRTKLEDEWFAVRAMRHVFHIRPNTTVQGWTTIMQPVLRCSYPMQYVLTLETADELGVLKVRRPLVLKWSVWDS